MSRKLSRRQFIGASIGVAAAASFGGAARGVGRNRQGGRALDTARPPRGTAVLGARCDGTAQHRVQQPARRDADHGLPRRPGLSGRPDRPRRARAAPGRVRRGVRVPRLGRRQGLRVLPVDAERKRVQSPPAADGCRDPAVPRRSGLEGGRDPSVRARQPRPGDRQPHGGRRDALRVPEHARDGDDGLLRQPVADSEQQPGPGEPEREPADRLGLAGGLREPRDRASAPSGSGAGRRTRTASARSCGRAGSSTSTTRSRTTTATSTTRRTPSSTRSTGSSG